MKIVKSLSDPLVIEALREGQAVIARTDTLYGLLARAEDEQAVSRVFTLKGRNSSKSPIVLISNREQLFDKPKSQVAKLMDDFWPGPSSIVVPSDNAPIWLSRGNSSVAYRQPHNDELTGLVSITGPLIAPSANPEGAEPAMNIDQAIEYFGEGVNVYVDGGEVTDSKPSKLLRINENGTVERLR